MVRRASAGDLVVLDSRRLTVRDVALCFIVDPSVGVAKTRELASRR